MFETVASLATTVASSAWFVTTWAPGSKDASGARLTCGQLRWGSQSGRRGPTGECGGQAEHAVGLGGQLQEELLLLLLLDREHSAPRVPLRDLLQVPAGQACMS